MSSGYSHSGQVYLVHISPSQYVLVVWSLIHLLYIDRSVYSIIQLTVHCTTNKDSNHEAFTNAVSMLGQRRRRWADIETTFGESLVFTGRQDKYATKAPATDAMLNQRLRHHNVSDRLKERVSTSKIIQKNSGVHTSNIVNTLIIICPVWIILNPCPAELFQIIFHSFKAGIANAISSFKWRKIFLFMKNKHLPNWNIWLAEHLPSENFINSSDVLFGLKLYWKRIYPGPARQGLKLVVLFAIVIRLKAIHAQIKPQNKLHLVISNA